MGDDRGQHPRPGSTASHGRRVTGSSVLTPPTGIPAVPLDMPGSRDAAPTPVVAGSACQCGHPSDVHRHWRPGSDCGQCGPGGCTAYRSRAGAVLRLLRSVGLRH